MGEVRPQYNLATEANLEGSGKRQSGQFAGVLIEFALSIPLLLVFIIGLLSSGRVLNTIHTVGQAAFLGAQLGSQVNNTNDLDRVPERIEKILGLQARRLKQVTISCSDNAQTSRCINGSSGVFYDPDPNSPDAKRIIKVRVNGQLETIFRNLDIDIEITAPVLLLDQGNTLNLDQPANPPVTYQCMLGNNANCDCCSNPVRGDYCQAC